MQNTLILMVGLPRSGKSTMARHKAAELALHTPCIAPIVSIDAIRLAIHGQAYLQEAEPYVWLIAHTMVKALFLGEHDTVILDACNNTRKRRDEWISKDWKREFIIVDTDAEECLRRALGNKGGNLSLVAVIERMKEQHEPVQPDELSA